MGKVIAGMTMSLDGFVAGEDGSGSPRRSRPISILTWGRSVGAST